MDIPKTLASRWLWLGVTALGLAGIFAIILVIARTPQLAALTVFQQLFSVALVVHVDLSVLMWFIAMLGLSTSLVMETHQKTWPIWPKAAFLTIAAATLLMALSPLDAHWQVIKSNYIPVLQNKVFLLALALLAAGLMALLIPVVLTALRSLANLAAFSVFELGVLAASSTALLALIAFFLSAHLLPAGLGPDEMYEQLFWAGGHILQFAFSLLMMAAWLVLLGAVGGALPQRATVLVTYLLMLAGAAASFAGFAMHASDTSDFTIYQTRMMIEAGGLGVGVLALFVILKLARTKLRRIERAYASTLIMSLILFIAGGLLGVIISGQNVTIPAHYHGMIVGITLSLMGLAYTMLPRFGYESVAHTRLAFWQPIVYGVGQLMHIGGLGYSGGYGVLRKTPGAIEGIALNVKIALGIMGAGGTLAIIGGILFVIVMLRARKAPSASRQPAVL